MNQLHPLKTVRVRTGLANRVRTEATRSFGPNGNLTGMRKYYGWDTAYPVKVGEMVYDVPKELYNNLP